MKQEPPSLQVDAFIIRTMEISPHIELSELSERIWYAYDKFMTNEDIQARLNVYYYEGINHFSLN